MSIFELVKNDIKPLDKACMKATSARIDKLIKPIGSLGKLEDIAIQLAGITGSVQNQFSKTCVVVMSADNGILEEGVACTPQATSVRAESPSGTRESIRPASCC